MLRLASRASNRLLSAVGAARSTCRPRRRLLFRPVEPVSDATMNRSGVFGGSPSRDGKMESWDVDQRTIHRSCVSGQSGWSWRYGRSTNLAGDLRRGVGAGIGSAETLRKWHRQAEVDTGIAQHLSQHILGRPSRRQFADRRRDVGSSRVTDSGGHLTAIPFEGQRPEYRARPPLRLRAAPMTKAPSSPLSSRRTAVPEAGNRGGRIHDCRRRARRRGGPAGDLPAAGSAPSPCSATTQRDPRPRPSTCSIWPWRSRWPALALASTSPSLAHSRFAASPGSSDSCRTELPAPVP
jgi:hypothetical protein